MSWLGRTLCRHGFHSWRFAEMYGARVIDVPGHSQYVCTLVELCRRCDIRRTSKNADIPKRVRT